MSIYPSLENINPVKLSGKLNLPLKYSNDIILEIEDLKVKRYMVTNSLYHFDFQYSFANNGDGVTFLSPFEKEQENFLIFLHYQKLDEQIIPKKNLSLLSKKIKL